jgi:hypothetical protein
MGTDPAVFAATDVLGKNPQIFPAVTLAFFTKRNVSTTLRQ